jgi:hypothetical protein
MRSISISDIENQDTNSLMSCLTDEELEFSKISIDCSSLIAHRILGGSDDSAPAYNLNNNFHPVELTKPPIIRPILRM